MADAQRQQPRRAQPAAPPAQQQQQPPQRKISSFQITSVTVGSRSQPDAGDDSADDLDESQHADVLVETPSCSEDTYSREDVFYNASSASLGCAPVIPTSAQYGLAIVGAQQPQEAQEDGGKEPEKDKEHEQVRNERFKVVKIESTEPFRRGRWTCMDYLDHSTQPPHVNNIDNQEAPEQIVNDVQHDEPPQLQQQQQQQQQQPQPLPAKLPDFPAVASPGQSLTRPIMPQQTVSPQTQPVSVPVQTVQSVQSPPVELPQQINQPNQHHAQSMSHVTLNQQPQHQQSTQQQQPPVQQIPQSFPSHQLQQAIAQGMPQMQQMQMHQQVPGQQMQQMQNQQAQIQMQNQQHMPHMQQMPPMPQIQQMQQPQMQHMQMQPTQPPMHQMHGQQPQMQPIPQHMQNHQQPQMQHMMQPQQMQPHIQQMPQMTQMSNQQQPMQMHQIPAQPMQQQMQQNNMTGSQHQYGGQQPSNPQGMMQQPMSNIGQQTQPIVPQFYQQTQLNQQGQSLTQEVMAGIVNSQAGTLPNNLQNLNAQQQGATLPANLQGMTQQAMHPIQPPQNMMMTQPTQNMPITMDSNQTGMQMPVSDPMYMQNTNQQMPLNQHIGNQQPMMPSSTSAQMTMSHMMPNQQPVGNQNTVVSQQLPQVSQPMMQNMVPNNQPVVQHQQGMSMPLQQNMSNTMPPSVHSVPTSVVQSQTNMHGQVGIPLTNFSGQQMPNMTGIGMPQMDVHITQQSICSTAPAPIMSGTNSPVVSLPVTSSMNYSEGQQNFGSPVMSNSTAGPIVSEISNDSGGGTPGSDGTVIDNDGKDDQQSGQNDDNESLSCLAMALGDGARPASPPQQPQMELHQARSASGTSAVAIDNKIEQAMDLVKSHLMFAVREEVEVLKEKIAELMEKINQLEVENSILRANASQETLAQLGSSPPPAASPPAGPVS